MIEIIREIGEHAIIREIGEHAINQIEIVDDHIPLLAKDPNTGSKKEFLVVIIDLIDNGNGLQFNKLDIVEIGSDNKDKFLYKEAPSKRSPDFSITTKITEGEIENSFQQRMIDWFKKYKISEGLIRRVGEYLNDNKKEIINSLKNLKLDTKKSYLLSLRINDRYIGEIPEFCGIFRKNISSKYSEFDKQKVYNSKGVCSLCGNVGEVFGNISPYTWYSLDKECYIASGFEVNKAWKNFATCFNCTLQLEAGKTYIDKYLDKNFAGVRFMLLPHLMVGGKDKLAEILMIYEDFDKRKISMSDDGKSFSSDEDEILSIAKGFEDYIAFNLVFYKDEQSKRRILMLLEDVYPSRLRQLYEIKEKMDELPTFMQNNIKFSFKDIKKLTSLSGDSVKEFLNYINRIFKGIPISYGNFMSYSAKYFQEAFVNDRLDKYISLPIFMCFLYIKNLNLFRDQKEVNRMNDNTLSIDGMDGIECYFRQFGNAFNSPAKKGVFLLGVLAQNLLDIQYSRTCSTPFRKNLKGLKLHKEDILGLLPAIQNKLEEYESNYYRNLESIISHYLLEAQSEWELNMDEINFYFVVGMNLNDVKDSENKPLFKFGEGNK